MSWFSGPELIVVLALALILFGVGRLGEVGGAVGKSIREFKKAVSDDEVTDTASKPAEAKAEETARS